MGSITLTEDINKSDSIGHFHIGTANVPVQGNYITLVLRCGRPFDMVLSTTVADALAAHERFCASAEVFNQVMQPLLDAVESMKPDDDGYLN